MSKSPIYLLLIFTLYSNFTYSAIPAGSEYLKGESNIGIVLCHGKGKHPKFKVVNPLRIGLNKNLGYHTLSIQMPNDDKNWKLYKHDFPDAYLRIKSAVDYLKQEQGIEKVFLIGHSMGSRMASSYLSEEKDNGISGLVIAGCRNGGGSPFNCKLNVRNINLPILDIWGGADNKDSRSASKREEFVSHSYTQVEVSGADHKFDGYEDDLLTSVSNWLKSQ